MSPLRYSVRTLLILSISYLIVPIALSDDQAFSAANISNIDSNSTSLHSGPVSSNGILSPSNPAPQFFGLLSHPDPSSFPKGSPEYLNLFLLRTQLFNDVVLFFLPPTWRRRGGWIHLLNTWLRNYMAGCTVYFLSGSVWCIYVYGIFGRVFFPDTSKMPSREAIGKQIAVSMKAMPLYTALPTFTEFLIERGFTKCYCAISEVGAVEYAIFTLTYLSLVEFGIYWMHRLLHDIKPLYHWLHATHHIYNKQNTLSPFAGLAFHPLDGILQACPHVLALCVLPTHFFTHMLLLFMEGVWTTNIHDNVDEKVFLLMGAAYHTIHHTTYKHNYGHYTIAMDWLFGTLRTPTQEDRKKD